MKKLSYLLMSVGLFLAACSGNKLQQQTKAIQAEEAKVVESETQNQKEVETTTSEKESTNTNKLVKAISIDELKKRLDTPEEGLQVYNFWATWCKPCIKELPYFEQIGETYKKQGVKVTLVSLDFIDVLEASVVPFVKKKQLKSEVLLLDPGKTKMNDWIDMISTEWSGTIPATIMVGGKEKNTTLHETEFSFEELEELVKSKL